jgi:hypothetical protein
MKKVDLLDVLLSSFAVKFKEDGKEYKNIKDITLDSFENCDVFLYADLTLLRQSRYGFYGFVGKECDKSVVSSIDCRSHMIGYRSISYLESEAMQARDQLAEIVRTYQKMFDENGDFIDDGSLDKWIMIYDDKEYGYYL